MRSVIFSDVASLFGDSGDEESFDGFGEGGSSSDSDSDLDFEGLDAEEDAPDPEEAQVPQPSHDTDDEEEEARWTAHLSDVQVPPFVAASGPNIALDNPSELDVFLNFLGDDLWDRVVEESNRYMQQKLGDRFASFHQITRAELKAFIGINLIMGINRLPNHALFWSNDDFLGNQGIKRVMTKNRFEEISQYLHFNDSTKEPARGAANFNRLFKVRTVIDYVRSRCQNNFKPTKNISVDDLYNQHMGGVDLADQQRQYYSVGRSLYKWYRYLFWFLLDISIINSFIVYNAHRTGQRQRRVKQLNFRVNLAKALIGGFSSTASLGHSAKRRKIENLSVAAENIGKHFSVKIEGRKKVCVHCKRVGRKTSGGRSVETTFQCLQCNVALCKTCFHEYHVA